MRTVLVMIMVCMCVVVNGCSSSSKVKMRKAKSDYFGVDKNDPQPHAWEIGPDEYAQDMDVNGTKNWEYAKDDYLSGGVSAEANAKGWATAQEKYVKSPGWTDANFDAAWERFINEYLQYNKQEIPVESAWDRFTNKYLNLDNAEEGDVRDALSEFKYRYLQNKFE